MTSALLCLSATDESRHACKNSVHSAKASIEEVAVIDFKKPMISFVLNVGPMAKKLIRVFLFFVCEQFYLFFRCFFQSELVRVGFETTLWTAFRLGCFWNVKCLILFLSLPIHLLMLLLPIKGVILRRLFFKHLFPAVNMNGIGVFFVRVRIYSINYKVSL